MRLVTGITNETPGWHIVLKQIGIPFEKVNCDRAVRPEMFSVLIVSHHPSRKERRNIIHYLHQGGSLLTEAHIAQSLLSQKLKRSYIKTIRFEDDNFWPQSIDFDFGLWSRIPENANYCRNQRARKLIGISSFGKGSTAILPSGFTSALLSTHVKQKYFHSAYGGRLPSEKVSKIAKDGIRYTIHAILQHLHHVRNMPFLHLCPFPDGAKNSFIFRVDTDFGTQHDVGELYRLCRENGIQATWFVETKSQAEWVHFYREMKDQEIGYHCFRHRIFSDYRTNRSNLLKGLSVLQKAGIHPRGFAAPYGEWSVTLGNLLQDLKFEYSSEFQLAYDTFPFYPYLETSFSGVLQIPVFPVSIGNLRRARHTKKDMVTYYQDVIRLKLAREEPIFFYHHPGHQNFDVIHSIFNEIRQSGVSSVRMGDFCRWWKRRDQIVWVPEFRENKLHFKIKRGDASVFIRAVLPDKKWAVFPFQDVVVADKLTWNEMNKPFSVVSSCNRKQHSWRLFVYRILNMYGKWKS